MKSIIFFIILSTVVTADIETRMEIWHPGENLFILNTEENINEAHVTIEDKEGNVMFFVTSTIESPHTVFYFDIPYNIKSGNYIIKAELLDNEGIFHTEYQHIKIENKYDNWLIRWLKIIKDFLF